MFKENICVKCNANVAEKLHIIFLMIAMRGFFLEFEVEHEEMKILRRFEKDIRKEAMYV